MNPVQNVKHLVTRLFGVLTSSPLGPAAQAEINGVLTEDQAALFWEQDSIDQRHSYEVAVRVRQRIGDDPAAFVAALLHDVGKRHSNAGPVGRSLATVLDSMRLPLPADWRRYRDHGVIGADDLREVGADRLAVAFAKGDRDGDDSIDAEVWEALVEADNA